MSDSEEQGSGRARRFRRTREDHLLEAAEDYTELVADLIEEAGEARTGTIASSLGVSHVTALRTIARLQDEGYLLTARHKPVTLTEKGRALATASRARHIIIVNFLEKLGVPAAQAEIDGEGIEHHISDITLECIRRFLELNSP